MEKKEYYTPGFGVFKLRLIKNQTETMSNKHTRIVLIEKRNPALNYDYKLHELLYEYFINKNSESNAKAIIMHPQTLYELLIDKCPEVQYGNSDSYWYTGIRVIRSYDIEQGEFLIA